MPKILGEIVELGARLVGARYGALGVLNEGKNAFSRVITAGVGEPVRANGPPPSNSLLSLPIQDSRPLRRRSLHLDLSSMGLPAGTSAMHSLLGVPLLSREGRYGNFYFAEKEGAPGFSAMDERLAENFARLAMRAIELPAAREHVRQDLATFRRAVGETEAVIIVNPAREIILWNGGAVDFFGYTAEEALGRRIDELLVPEEELTEWRGRYVHHHTRHLRSGSTIRYKAERRHKDGHKIPIMVTLSPIRHGAAGLMAVTAAFHMRKT